MPGGALREAGDAETEEREGRVCAELRGLRGRRQQRLCPRKGVPTFQPAFRKLNLFLAQKARILAVSSSPTSKHNKKVVFNSSNKAATISSISN